MDYSKVVDGYNLDEQREKRRQTLLRCWKTPRPLPPVGVDLPKGGQGSGARRIAMETKMRAVADVLQEQRDHPEKTYTQIVKEVAGRWRVGVSNLRVWCTRYHEEAKQSLDAQTPQGDKNASSFDDNGDFETRQGRD